MPEAYNAYVLGPSIHEIYVEGSNHGLIVTMRALMVFHVASG
jgi:hypothetical protein